MQKTALVILYVDSHLTLNYKLHVARKKSKKKNFSLTFTNSFVTLLIFYLLSLNYKAV